MDIAAYHRGIALHARRTVADRLSWFRELPRHLEHNIQRARAALLVEQQAMAALAAVDPEAAEHLRREIVPEGRCSFSGGLLTDLIGDVERQLPPSPELAELLVEVQAVADRVRGLAARVLGPVENGRSLPVSRNDEGR